MYYFRMLTRHLTTLEFVSWVLFFLSLLAIAISLAVALFRFLHRLTCTKEGEILIAAIQDMDRSDVRLYHLELNADGKICRETRRVSMDRDLFREGQYLTVRYNPRVPEGYKYIEELDRRRSLLLPALLLLALSLFMMTPHQRMQLTSLLRSVKTPSARKEQVNKQNEFTYILDREGNPVLSGYTGSANELTLPLLMDGRMVNGMRNAAFIGNRTLTDLTVPGFYRSVSAGAFSGCLRLERVYLRSGVARIESHAFSACPSLKEVVLPSSITYISTDAFPQDCGARFHVLPGSFAEQFCQRCGYTVVVDEQM